jgi:hypothetical protein
MGSPEKAIRSRTLCRWGEVNRPVFRPISRRRESMMRVVDVLPFVPVRWMTG